MVGWPLWYSWWSFVAVVVTEVALSGDGEGHTHTHNLLVTKR